MGKEKVVYLFLAHQDDEIPLIPHIRTMRRLGCSIYVYIFTNGVSDGEDAIHKMGLRNRETIASFGKMGIKDECICFLSEFLPPNDQKLAENIDKVIEVLSKKTETHEAPNELYCLANEGGHPDHDCLEWIARAWIKKKKYETSIFNYYIYRLSKNFIPIILFNSPLNKSENNIKTLSVKIDRIWSLKILNHILCYFTQWKTFLVLGPIIISNWFIKPVIYLEKKTNYSLCVRRPNTQNILYEYRGWCSFEDVKKSIENSELFKKTNKLSN